MLFPENKSFVLEVNVCACMFCNELYRLTPLQLGLAFSEHLEDSVKFHKHLSGSLESYFYPPPHLWEWSSLYFELPYHYVKILLAIAVSN